MDVIRIKTRRNLILEISLTAGCRDSWTWVNRCVRLIVTTRQGEYSPQNTASSSQAMIMKQHGTKTLGKGSLRTMTPAPRGKRCLPGQTTLPVTNSKRGSWLPSALPLLAVPCETPSLSCDWTRYSTRESKKCLNNP